MTLSGILQTTLLACFAANLASGVPGVNPSECRSLIDLCFVIDGSDSIATDEFALLRDAIASFVPELQLGDNMARMGMLVYSSGISGVIPFSSNAAYLQQQVSKTYHPRDGTLTAEGIRRMREMFIKHGRPGVPYVGVVITDGISKNETATAIEAALAQAEGISMFAVGITTRIKKKELNAIASSPSQVIKLNRFNQLKGVLKSMMTTICPCPNPPDVPYSKCAKGARAIGTKRLYSCLTGYKLVGNPAITCRSDSTWTPFDFQCVTCGNPHTVTHATCGGDGYLLKTRRPYTCATGYQGVGDRYTECLPDATWSKPTYKCVVPCGPTPPVTHGICGGGDSLYGSRREYACEDRYAGFGNNRIVCKPDGTWSQPDFRCRGCGDTHPIQNATCGGQGNLLKTRREYKCDYGYQGVGNAFTECLPDATWSMPTFNCREPCGLTPTVTNGTCSGGSSLYGSKRLFVCDNGLAGFGIPEIVCQPDGSWSLPNYQCRGCGNTHTVKHATCGGDGYLLKTRRPYTCDTGYQGVGDRFTECLPDATWSMPTYNCVVPCGKETPPVRNGTCSEGLGLYGSKRMYVCDNGLAGFGSPEIVCLPDGRWSLPDYQCRGCGNTHTVTHATCGGDGYLLKTRRPYTCDIGYQGVGDRFTECLPDATWSMPTYNCVVPCGKATPPVRNGTCSEGSGLYGSKRMYVCDNGLAGFGSPEIVCLPDGRWSLPDYQCRGCGNTHTVTHATCGGDGYLLKTRRPYTCDIGYQGVGDRFTECLPDATWSMPTYNCVVPCGKATPPVRNGTCSEGSGLYGSKRMYVCDNGLAGFGSPEIVCLPDGRWSLPDYQCRGCGNTHTVTHATCGGDGYLLKTRRPYTCDFGYEGVGDPFTECLPDATWSMPTYNCVVPCGKATPPVRNGTCSEGSGLYGSKRMYVCDNGLAGFGSPEIVCLPDGRWSLPDYQCRGCGNTHTVTHATCGGDGYLLKTRRPYTCDIGYQGVGDRFTECLPDATWSMPTYNCVVPCGKATPPVRNGTCSEGSGLYGSKRMYVCDNGLAGFGSPEIVCLPDGRWSLPDYQCRGCGNTHTVTHATCGGDGYLLKTRRPYTCDIGYQGVGDPFTECLPDATWSMPTYECLVPCGEPPKIDFGFCSGGPGGLYGHKRNYACDDKYAGFGNGEIFCQPDGTWSPTDYMCRGCLKTPELANALCGVGDSLVRSRRMFQCTDGYIPGGDPWIECLDNGEWSQPLLTCRDCGAPPNVSNAYAQLGPSVVGSKREYFCEVGYELVGGIGRVNPRGEVTCRPDGLWNVPRFSCQVRTTTTTTTPAPVPTDPSVCDECRVLNGVGYNRHPYDCNQYIQCYIGRSGMRPVYRRCPFGLYWDQVKLTCVPSQFVDCPTDPCKNPLVRGYKHSENRKCCSYWKCSGGVSTGECCGDYSTFSQDLGRCVDDFSCQDQCPHDDTLPGCINKPGKTDTSYQVHVGNDRWVEMPCGPGTAYSTLTCDCSLHVVHVPGKPEKFVCKPELYIPFEDGLTTDRSDKPVYVLNEGVSIQNGAGFFNGNARLLVNRFSNTAFRGDLVIKFRYREDRFAPTAGKLQALVTNGDCGSDPSIIIAKMPGFVILGAKTDAARSMVLPTIEKEWKEVIYIHDEKRLEGKVCGTASSKWSWGPIQATHCAIQIGYGQALSNYVGHIDDLYIYQCRPSSKVLNLNY